MNPRNSPPVVRDQSDDLLLTGGLQHPHPGHLTEYERRQAAYRRGRRLGRWLPWLLLAAGIVLWLAVVVLPW